MSQELLRDALDRAHGFPPAVRSAALCHIARVLAKSDPAEACRVLEDGLALAAGLPDAEERETLLGEGAVLAATIAPARAFEILETLGQGRATHREQALARMIDHGFVDAAAGHVLESPLDTGFPFSTAMRIVGPSDDAELKRGVLRRAIAAMRETGPRSPLAAHGFVELLRFQWRLLPPEEARAAVREHVQRILAEPDSAMDGRIGAGSAHVVFRSRHEHALFEILEPLQELDPDLAASVIPRYPTLSAAAWRFPRGLPSMLEQMEKETAAAREAAPPPADACVDYVQVGGFVAIPEALRTEFAGSFAAAMDEYDRDADPDDRNEAPQQCWPSAAAFRTILYKAGEYEGIAAARYLDRIPDPALRLFAQIELAAALAGLPQLGSTTMRRGARARRFAAAPPAQGLSVPPEIPPELRPLPPARKPDLPPSRQLRVSPATAPAGQGPSGGSGPDFVDIRNASLASVVSHLFETPPSRIEWPASIDPASRYDFLLVLPQEVSDDERLRLVRDGIAAHFNLRTSTEDRARNVWVLTAPNGLTVRARRAPSTMGGFGSIGFSDVGIEVVETSQPRVPDAVRLCEILCPHDQPRDADPAVAQQRMHKDLARSLAAMTGGTLTGIHGELTIAELSGLLEPGLDRPLIDETGLDDRYMIRFDGGGQDGDFLRALTSHLGLRLSSGQRPVSTLVVSAV